MSNYATAGQVLQFLYGIDFTPLTKTGANILDIINFRLPVIKRQMDNAMHQQLDDETVTNARLDGKGSIEMLLPWWPIRAVTSCVINYGWASGMYTFQNIHHTRSRLLGLPADANDLTADLIVDRDKGIISINPSSLTLVSLQGNLSPLWNWVFTEGKDNVRITLEHGWLDGTIPPDVSAAHAMLTAASLAREAGMRNSGGATSVRIGSVSRTWGKTPYEGVIDSWEAQAKDIMAYYTVREAYE